MFYSRRCARSRRVAAAPRETPRSQRRHGDDRRALPRWASLTLWVALAACASTLLVSITNHLSQNVAPIPLLWVLPLALYLLTFILAFESDRIYRRWLFLPLLVPALGAMAYMIWADSGNLHIKWLIPGFAAWACSCAAWCAMASWRAASPRPRYLTTFYLMVSLGGAMGGIFVALIAPRVFHSYLELQVGLVACALLAISCLWNVPWKGSPRSVPARGSLRTTLVIAAGVLAGYLVALTA